MCLIGRSTFVEYYMCKAMNRSNMWQARQKTVLVRKVPLPGSEMSRYRGRLLPRFAQDIKQFFVIIRNKECQKN